MNSRSDTFSNMTKSAIRIDNQLHKRRMKKKNRNYISNIEKIKMTNTKEKDYDFYKFMLMKLNATQKINDKDRKHNKTFKCFNCEKKDHYAKNCYQKKNKRRQQERLRVTKEYELIEAREEYDTIEVMRLRVTRKITSKKDLHAE